MTNSSRTASWIILGTPEGEEARTVTARATATRAAVAKAHAVPFARVLPVFES